MLRLAGRETKGHISERNVGGRFKQTGAQTKSQQSVNVRYAGYVNEIN